MEDLAGRKLSRPERDSAQALSFFRSEPDLAGVRGTGGESKRFFSLRTTSAVTRYLPLSLRAVGQLEHDVEHDLLDDRPQAAGAGVLGLGHLGDLAQGARR